MNHSNTPKDTPAWIFFVWAAFITSACVMAYGIYYTPGDMWVKGFLWMGQLFITSSSLTLAKTTRDNFEAQRSYDRPREAKHDYEVRGV